MQPAAEEGAFRDHQIAQTTIDNALDGIITVDDAGVIRSANPAAEQIFGYQAPEMYGHNISMLMPEPHVSHHDDYIRRYLETGERRIIGIGRELTGRHRDGSLIELHLAIAEGFAHGQRYFVGFTHDIGPRKRAEREARQHLAQLARTTRIYAMDALASSLAHEIRQPLTAVYTTAQACLILLDTDQQEPATLKESLRQITRQARRASEITDQLHHFVQQGETNELAEHDCLALIDDVLLLLAHKLHEAGVWPERHYNNLSQCGTKINRVLIEQVVFNLIDNAIDAMRETAPPRVVTAAACLSACGSWCEIEILDTGPGIPEEHLSKLFTPYFTTKPHGTGQGLALSKSIVEKHGGQLSARNPPAGGAAFRLTLPLDQKCRGHA
ncbi:nitrogen regulation protein NR(II) [Aquisalimonas sp.]|uniref:two-component system sensor histidine kinase NtrB n=1 Tax=Aquisalimonas sp. TaxID=1872621 RepID=UPI0025BEE2AA|nr:PAS domain S-box protein [Aquisalimonas sp.]